MLFGDDVVLFAKTNEEVITKLEEWKGSFRR